MSTAAPAAPRMPVQEILGFEARWRPRVAVVAVVAGVLLMAGSIVEISGPHAKVSELTLGLIVEHKRFLRDVVAAILSGLGAIGVSATLVFLWWSVRARNPATQGYLRVLAIFGGVLYALAGILFAIVYASAVHKFVSTGSQTYQEANHLMSGGGLVISPLAYYAGELVLAVSLVLLALAALRVGILTRFMGYFGMAAGVLFLFPLLPVPLVQAYWLIALAYLLWGRWPTGVPRAWTSGQAERWPTTQEVREQRVRAAGARGGGGGRAKPARQPEPVGAPARQPSRANANANAGARSGAKRKRKRRK